LGGLGLSPGAAGISVRPLVRLGLRTVPQPRHEAPHAPTSLGRLLGHLSSHAFFTLRNLQRDSPVGRSGERGIAYVRRRPDRWMARMTIGMGKALRPVARWRGWVGTVAVGIAVAVGVAAALSSAEPPLAVATGPQQRPNVVVVETDDQTVQSMKFMSTVQSR